MNESNVNMRIGCNTRYIISTSGRISSLKRYQVLLQEILSLDIAYIPIHSNDSQSSQISPKSFSNALRGLPCIGGAISKDIKHLIIPYLDHIDASASQVQSVNTVVCKGNTLIGYNTDVIGFRLAITQGIESSKILIKSAVCYGYGGVTSVVVSVLKELGIYVYLAGRNMTTARERAITLGCEIWEENKTVAELFVNATPASGTPLDGSVNFLASISTCQIAFDHEMPGKYLVDYCREKNVYHISGYDMYYPQMYSQWTLFLDGLVETDKLPELIREAESKSKT